MTVVVRGKEGLTVDDAMRQVLETFELLDHSAPDPGKVVWRLVSASTNTPLTVVAEATSRLPGVNVTREARLQKRAFAQGFADLRHGRLPSVWRTSDARRKARSLYGRTHDGILETEIRIDERRRPVVVSAVDAPAVESALSGALGDTKRHQVGSVEGFLSTVETWYHKPAVRIRERGSGREIICEIPEEFRASIGSNSSFEDVWKERRVRVRGRLNYDEQGKIASVYATDVKVISVQPVSTDSIKDPDFTSGMTPSEYLEKIRDGDLG